MSLIEPLPKKARVDNTIQSPQLEEESTLIWKQGDTFSSTGSVLVRLAQNGYTREAHQIIGLSRTASLIGRDSNGGLPELWDVMGKVRNKRGITRLMAICITRGPDSPQRALSLIRDHKVDVRATDKKGRTALYHALGVNNNNCDDDDEEEDNNNDVDDDDDDDSWVPNIPLNLELIRVLLQADPKAIKRTDKNGRLPLHFALGARHYDDYSINSEVIRYLIELYPESVKTMDYLSRLPLHYACLNRKTTIKQIRYMIECFPQGLREAGDKESPELPLSCACSHDAPYDIIKLLIDSYPKGLNITPLYSLSSAKLIRLLYEKVVKENAVAIKNVIRALKYSFNEDYYQTQIHGVDAGATFALTSLLYEQVVKENGSVASKVANALAFIAKSERGQLSCLEAGTPSALVALTYENAVIENLDAIKNIVVSIGYIAHDVGRQACIDAGAVLALVALSNEEAVKENAKAAECIADALGTIAESETGCQSCIDAGAPLVLTELAREKLVKENVVAARYIANALSNIAKSNAGRQSCIDAQAPLALVSLSHGIEDDETIKSVKKAIWIISGTEIGRQACIDAEAPHSFIDWASKKSSRMNDLIMMNGTGAANTGSVLVILAQNGYTQEAHQIIGLSRTASLIGRDSDGGLPELWDIMGKVKGKQGITRLMAICITRGPDSPQRALSLIRDHKVNVRATDKNGRTALHLALGIRIHNIDSWPYNTTINLDLIKVLVKASPEVVKIKDDRVQTALQYALGLKFHCRHHYYCECSEYDYFSQWPEHIALNLDLIRILVEACPNAVNIKDDDGHNLMYEVFRQNSSYSAIKVLIDAYPMGLTESALEDVHPTTLTALAKEKSVKENGYSTGNIAYELGRSAYMDPGRQECIDAGATLALVEMLKTQVAKTNQEIVQHVAKALMNISKSDAGRQSCVDAGAPLALVSIVAANHADFHTIVDALKNIAESDAGRQSCIDAGAPLALTTLVAANHSNYHLKYYLSNISKAFINIAKSDTGRQSCIDAGAPLALTNFMVTLSNDDYDYLNPKEKILSAFKAITGTDFIVSTAITQSENTTRVESKKN
jgi:ankyrin repeat protein